MTDPLTCWTGIFIGTFSGVLIAIFQFGFPVGLTLIAAVLFLVAAYSFGRVVRASRKQGQSRFDIGGKK